MKLHEHIKTYHNGVVAQFAKSIGQTPQLVAHWLGSGGYAVVNNEIIKRVRKLPQSELDHIKKVRGES